MNLPEDLIVEVLSKLPVKSLFISKSVSKLWYSLIKSQNFITKHIKNQTNPSLLISHRDNVTNKRVVSFLTNDNLETYNDQDLPTFFNDKFGHIRLVGPCHGLVCLYGFPDNIGLWNPSIREFKSLPRSSIPRPTHSKVRGGDLGLGFDSKTNDYKVIQILFCLSNQHGFAYQVEIYSLLTDSWRKYESIVPANIMYINIWSMVYKNETFCWWAKDGNNIEVILSFDISKEVFKKTPLPSGIATLGGHHKIIRAILPIHESIGLVVYRLKQVEKCFDIWVMKNLENKESSWIRLSTIGPLLGVERPLGFLENGEFVLESCSRELVFCDVCRGEMKGLGIYGKRDRLEVLNYKQSLVSVNSSRSIRR